MLNVLYDIEGDDLLPGVTKMWVIVLKDLDTGVKKWWLLGDLGWQKELSEARLVVGHNIIAYDNMVLKKLFDFEFHPDCVFHDTMIISQIMDFRRFDNDGHSLERWGQFLGYPKIQFNDFSRYTPEMLEYCKNDVEVNYRVYDVLKREIAELAEFAPQIKDYLRAEHAAAQWCAEGNLQGWPFEAEKGFELKDVLEEETSKVLELLTPRLGLRCVAVDRKPLGIEGSVPFQMESLVIACDERTHYVEVKKPKWTKSGCYDAFTCRWFDVEPMSGYDDPSLEDIQFHRMIRGEYCRVEFRPLLLSSNADVKTFLARNGWKPTEWNFKFDPETRKKIKMSPKVTEDSLELLGGDGALYVKYLSAKSRLAILDGWLLALDEEQKLHGDIMLVGTPSMRARHSIIANIPSGDAPWGKEVRELFVCEEGWELVGCDSAGNQARGLAHYLGNEEYTHILLHDDIHNYNAGKATEALKQMGIEHTVPRPIAKRLYYATLFGASGGKLWGYIFGTMDDAQGAIFKDLFLKAIPGFDTLMNRLEDIFKKTKKKGYGYIPSLAGNRVYVDSKHKLLVYLLQSAEKVTCSAACMLLMKYLKEEKIPYKPKVYYHDELDFSTPKEYAQRAKELGVKAFQEGPKLFGVQIMDGGGKVGKDWYEIH